MLWQSIVQKHQTGKHSTDDFTAIDKSEVEN